MISSPSIRGEDESGVAWSRRVAAHVRTELADHPAPTIVAGVERSIRSVLRRTLLPLDCINPSLALRLPDSRALSEKLDSGISAILGGQPAQTSLAAVASSWDATRAGRPEALKEVSPSVETVLAQLSGGVQSGLGYLGARDLPALRKAARFVRVTSAGQRESAPHDIIEVKATK